MVWGDAGPRPSRSELNPLFPWYTRWGNRVLAVVTGFIAHRLYRITVEGGDRVPLSGPAILAPCHASTLDPPFVGWVIRRRAAFLAKAEYWDKLRTRFFFQVTGQLPVRREDPALAKAGLDAAVLALELGGVVVIHPEGTRSPDGRLYKGRTGVARLAALTGAPVIPVGLTDTYSIWPRGKRLPTFFKPVTIRFGEPMRFDGAIDGDKLRGFVDELMRRIQQLSGQEYVDAYSGHGDRTES